MIDERLEAPPRQLVFALDRLIGICRGADRHRTLRVPPEIHPESLDEVRLDLDVLVERVANVPIAVTRVVGTGKAIAAGVGAADVRIQAPIEWHALDRIERALCFDFAIDD